MANGATTPPMCQLCGTAHWFREPHQFGNAKVAKVDLLPPRPKSQRERQMVDITPARLAAARKVLDDAPVPPLDRVIVQQDGTIVVGPKSGVAVDLARLDLARLDLARLGMRPGEVRTPINPVMVEPLRAAVAKAGLASVTKKGVPRQRAPKGTVDRKAAHAELMRKKRAAARAAKQ